MKRLLILSILPSVLSVNTVAQCTSQVIASYYPGMVCSGRAFQLSVTTIPGASYVWTGPSGYYATGQNPIVVNASPNLSGAFVVTATIGSCVYKDTVNVTVGITPAQPQIGTNNPPCAAGTLQFTLIGSGAPQTTYTFFNPSGTPMSSVIFNLNSSHNGIYKAIATHTSGCVSDTGTYNLQVITLSKPQITGNQPICKGDSLTLGVIENNAAINNYYWNINGSPQYTPPEPLSLSSVNIGGFVSLQVVKSSCFSPADTAYFMIKPAIAPETKLSMSGQIDPNGSTITLSAGVMNGGANPIFLWYRNDLPIPGASNQTYTGFVNADILHNDRFYVEVTRETDSVCGGTANSDTVQLTLNLGVDDVDNNGISLYPNPNNGVFEINLPGVSDNAMIAITDVTGREVWRATTTGSVSALEINTASSLQPGLYLLRVYDGQRTYYTRFTIQR